MEISKSDIVISLAGRDKGNVFFVMDTDGVYVFLADGKLSAHYENTVLITDGEPEILTVAEGL